MENALLSGLQTMPAMQQAQNLAQSGQIANKEALIKLQQEQKFNSLLGSMSTPGGSKDGGQPMNPSDVMMQLASRAIKAGLPQGITLYNQAAAAQEKLAQGAAETVRAHASQQNANTQQHAQMLKQHQQSLQFMSGLLDGVHDQSTWDQATRAYAQRTGDGEYVGTPYDPQVINGLKTQALGAKGMVDMHLKQLEQQNMQDFHNQELALRKLSVQVAQSNSHLNALRTQATQERTRIAAERETRMAKTGGGKAISPPPQGMVDNANALIHRQFPDMNSTDAVDFSYAVASEARKITQQNPGVDVETATMRAIDQLKDQYIMNKPSWGGLGPDKATFNPAGTGVPLTVKTPQEVVAAYKAGKIPKAEAENFLRAMGAH